MKAVLFQKPWEAACIDVPKPQPGPGQALIRIVSAGICGSDIGAYRGTNALVSYPRIIGHELAGIVEQIPEDNAAGIKPGDRVVVNPYVYCGHCYPCSLGRTNCCTDLKCLGVHIDGGMAEYFCHPADMLIPLPDNVPWDTAPIAEPLVIALHGLHRGALKAGEHAAIIGAGPIGLLAAMAAKALGAAPILLDVVDARLEFARDCGIQFTINTLREDAVARIADITGGRMAELVCECSGANAAIRSTLELVSSAGRITLTGWPAGETPLPTAVITRKEVDIRGARTAMTREFADSLAMIADGSVDVRKILTKTISIDEAPATIADIEKNPGNYMKVNVLF